MKPLRITGQFKKDFRACKKRGFRMKKLEDIIDKLRTGEPLSPIDDDHPLKGPWQNYRGCHPQGDWILIYRNDGPELELARTGPTPSCLISFPFFIFPAALCEDVQAGG